MKSPEELSKLSDEKVDRYYRGLEMRGKAMFFNGKFRVKGRDMEVR